MLPAAGRPAMHFPTELDAPDCSRARPLSWRSAFGGLHWKPWRATGP
jgi:hypothetical protein